MLSLTGLRFAPDFGKTKLSPKNGWGGLDVTKRNGICSVEGLMLGGITGSTSMAKLIFNMISGDSTTQRVALLTSWNGWERHWHRRHQYRCQLLWR